MAVSLDQLNGLSVTEAEELFLACCGSTRWARTMARERPFESFAAMVKRGDEVWRSGAPTDWEEAFARHPRIGERAASGTATARDWSVKEQRAAAGADGEIRAALALANAEYERRFGRTYIVCATGRTGTEILLDLKDRLRNDPKLERGVAAEEQRKITRLRLEKLCPG